MTYFSESVVNTRKLLDLLVKCENKVSVILMWRSCGPFTTDTNTYQDRSQFKDAKSFPSSSILQPQGVGWTRHVINGTCVDTSV